MDKGNVNFEYSGEGDFSPERPLLPLATGLITTGSLPTNQGVTYLYNLTIGFNASFIVAS